MRQVVLGRGLRGRQANGRGKGADDGRHAGLVHLLDLGRAGLRLRLRVAQQRFELQATERLDATGLVDVLDGHERAKAALLARIGQRPRHRMQHADLDGLGLGVSDQRKSGGGGQGGGLRDEAAAVLHGAFLFQLNWAETSLLTHTLASMPPTRDNCIS